jgi:SAM-dependent methyltransferase
MAPDYDRAFSESAIGRHMRAAVWRRLDAAFRPGDRVLELNCGTGEDAVYLGRRGVRVLATDISAGMLDVARAKVARAGLAGVVQVERLDITELRMKNEELRSGASSFSILNSQFSVPFDGVLSNFGGLNCVADLPGVARGLAALLRPGGRALLCVMGPLVPWEWGWYLAHGQPRKAFRRLRPGGTPWRGLTIRYPSAGALRRAFAPHFVQRRVAAVGALLPPSYAEPWAARRPRLLAALDRWERRAETLPPLPWLADHYLIELERVV